MVLETDYMLIANIILVMTCKQVDLVRILYLLNWRRPVFCRTSKSRLSFKISALRVIIQRRFFVFFSIPQTEIFRIKVTKWWIASGNINLAVALFYYDTLFSFKEIFTHTLTFFTYRVRCMELKCLFDFSFIFQ